jgi:fructokinase
MKNANSTVLNGRPLEADLRARLKRPVRIANDANCFTLSEAVDGAGSDAKVVFGVILGTGAGGGIAVHRRVLAGANGIAGEWAHNPLPWPTRDEQPGPACYCGKSGCIETFVSGPGMAARFRERTNRTLEAREIVQAAREGDAQASAEFDRYVDRLARSLTLVVNVLGPEAIVLGGGLSNVSELYEHLGPAMKPYVFSDSFDTRSGRRGSGTAAACAAPRTSASMR